MAHASISVPARAGPRKEESKNYAHDSGWAGIGTLAVGFVFKYVLSTTVITMRLVRYLLARGDGYFSISMAEHSRCSRDRGSSGRVFGRNTFRSIAGRVACFFWASRWASLERSASPSLRPSDGLLRLGPWDWLRVAGDNPDGVLAIRKRLVALHKEWMIRAYVVTFAFVTFRVLSDYGPTSRLQPENDRSITIAWACWVVPLAATEMIFQLRRMRTATARR